MLWKIYTYNYFKNIKNNDFVLKFVPGSALTQKARKLYYIYTNEPYACKHKQPKIHLQTTPFQQCRFSIMFEHL